MNYEVVREIQRICAGEPRELTRGQIVEETLDIDALTGNFNDEKSAECREFYQQLLADESVKLYDVDSLTAEKEEIRRQFEDFCREHRDSDIFRAMYDDISNFFMTPPFEGLDHIEYGVNEVCVFSVLEYFVFKASPELDDARCRQEYRDSLERRTSEPVAEHWIGVYDDLQNRYAKLVNDSPAKDNYGIQEKLAACCIVAIAAIKDQDAFALDMAQGMALDKGRSILDEYRQDEPRDGGSEFTSNVVKLYEFVWEHIRSEV